MSVQERPRLAIVVAMSAGGIIGKDGGLPWRIPEDLRFFKRVTTDHAVIMGRKTFESIGRPLPSRRNIVVSRTAPGIPGCEVCPSFEAALALARETDDEPRVIGGRAIYECALPLATRIFLTEVHLPVTGDTYFPAFDRSEWRVVSRRPAETEGVEFVELER